MHRWLVWNILFPLQEWVKGHPTYSILREMEAADRLSASELEQLRGMKLRQMIEYCYAHVPYVRTRMREAGVQPAQIREPRDLVLLPLMTKADVRQHRARLHSDLAGRLTPFSTGGSTGEPLLFDLSQARIAAAVACRQRVSRWWGVSVGDPEFVLWGSPIELTRQDWLRKIRDRLFASQLISAFEMTEDVMSQYLDLIIQRGCKQLFGYPSSIYLLCLHARKQGRDLTRSGIQVVFVTGEVFFPYQRELISQTLNCPVANGYGGRDSGFLAHECPQGGMHVMADAVLLELVGTDGLPVPMGEAGEIVVTDLYSRETPFIRYATGDFGVLSPRACPCGRPLPLLEKIEGRSTDIVLTPDGRFLHALSLIYVMREIEGIEQYKIIQRRTDSFQVQLVRNGEYRMESESKIREGLGRRLRSQLQVEFEYLSQFPPERSGKFRHVVCEIPLEERECRK